MGVSEHDEGPGASDASLRGPLAGLDRPPPRGHSLVGDTVKIRNGGWTFVHLEWCQKVVWTPGNQPLRQHCLTFVVSASPVENVTIDINSGVARTVGVIPQEALPEA